MDDTLEVGRIGWWRFQNGDLTDQSGNGRDLVCVGTQVNAVDKDGIANNAVNLYNLVNDKFTLKGDTNLIDGSVSNVKYIPLCGKCYLDEKRKYEEE